MREGRRDASLAKRVLCILHPQRPAAQGGDGYVLRGEQRIGAGVVNEEVMGRGQAKERGGLFG